MQSDKVLAVVAHRQNTDSESSIKRYFNLFQCWSQTSPVSDLAVGQPYGWSICCRYVYKTYIIDIMPYEKRAGGGGWGLLLLHQTTRSKQILFPCLGIGDMAGKWGRRCIDLWPFTNNSLVEAATPFIWCRLGRFSALIDRTCLKRDAFKKPGCLVLCHSVIISTVKYIPPPVWAV